MKRLIFTLVMALMVTGQVWAADYTGIYVNKQNGGDIEIKKNGLPNDEYEVHITVVPPGTAITGEVTFSGFFSGGTAIHAVEGCWLKLTASGKTIKIQQDAAKGNCDAGMNVTFDGTYKKYVEKKK